MKKLSVLVALMLIITVGGVYATWNYAYATGTATPDSGTIATITLAEKRMSGEDSNNVKGDIQVTAAAPLTILIEDNGSHRGEFHVSGEPITVKFVPDANAKEDVRNNGIPMLFELTCEGLQDFPTIIESINTTKHFTIDAGTIETLLQQRWTVNLPTASDYDDFVEELAGKTITVTVYENVDYNDRTEGGAGGGDWGEPGEGA